MSPIISIFSGFGPLALLIAKATLVLVAAVIATLWLRHNSAGARHLVWLTALVGVMVLPLLSRVEWLRVGVLPSALSPRTEALRLDAIAPSISVIALPATEAIVAERPEQEVAAEIGDLVGEQAALPAPKPAQIVVHPIDIPNPLGGEYSVNNAPSILEIIASVWAMGALIVLAWLGAGAMAVRRIVAKATELTSHDWTTPLCEVADRLDLELPPRLVMSDRIEMAFVCRAFSPTVVLPASAESWPDDRRRAVLFHELAHVKRHDLLGHLLGRLACALYWFHPLVWTAAKKLRAESERACDDLVLSCGARPSEYAQHLLDMITSVRNYGAPVMALPMARKKEFEGRMLAILDPAIRRASPGRLQTAGVVASLALLSVMVAAVSPARASTIGNSNIDILMTPSAPEPVAELSASPSPSPSPTPSALAPWAPQAPTAVAQAVTSVATAAASQVSREFARALRGGEPPDSARVELLVRILVTDSDPSVRRTAAWGLNEASSSKASEALIKALQDDKSPDVREMAAWALADQPGANVSDALGDALHDGGADVRVTAAWALGQRQARSQMSNLESVLDDPDKDVRHAAAWAVGQMDLERAPRSLPNLLTDASPDVRLVAAWALAEIGDKTTAPSIVNAFQSETNAEVRGAELRALAAVHAASPAIIEAALSSSDAELRRRAVAMLAGSDNGVWAWPWPWPQPRPMP